MHKTIYTLRVKKRHATPLAHFLHQNQTVIEQKYNKATPGQPAKIAHIIARPLSILLQLDCWDKGQLDLRLNVLSDVLTEVIGDRYDVSIPYWS